MNWPKSCRPRAGRLVLLIVAISSMRPTSARAVPAETLGVQGRFLTAVGQPVPDGNYSVTVNFYKLQGDVTPLYFETQPSVTVKGGLFSIQAGSVKTLNTADFKSGDASWVGLKIAAEAELPRVPLKFVPYALRAQSAADLNCTACVKSAYIDPTVLTPYAKTTVLATATMLPALDGVPCGSGLVVKGFNINGTLNCVAAGTYSAGAGLTLTGSTLALAAPTTLALGGVLAKACTSPLVVTGVDTAGNLTCGNAVSVTGSAASFTGNLGGDVTGVQGATVVGKLQGRTVAATVPPLNSVLKYNGTIWAPATDETVGGTGGETTGAGTANSVVKWASTTSQTNSLLFDNGTNVGVGTSSPSEKLHVAGNLAVTGGSVRVSNLGGSGTAFVQTDNAGNLTATPAPTLSGLSFTAPAGDPAPTITARTVPVGQGNANERTELILFHSNDPDNGSGADVITLRAPSLRFQTYNDAAVADINNNAGSNDRLYIAPNGNVGIGTSTPATTLHVNGSVRGNQSGALRIDSGVGYLDVGAKNPLSANFETDLPKFYFNKGIMVDNGVVTSNATNLTLQTSGNTRMTVLNSNGFVGIGTTTPGYLLDVNGTLRAKDIVSTERTQTFKVQGNINYFYPVVFIDAHWYDAAYTLELSRADVHADSTWQGSTIARFRGHDSGCGHGSDFLDVDIRQNVTGFVGGYGKVPGCNGNYLVVWLKGQSTYTMRGNHFPNSPIFNSADGGLVQDGQTLAIKTSVDGYVMTAGQTYSSNLRVLGDATVAGNLGVGTYAPAHKLDVAGNIRATGTVYANANGGPYLCGGDDACLYDVNVANTVGIYGAQNSALGTLRLGTGGADISGSGGNIGIGTVNPGAKLDVQGGATRQGNLTTYVRTMSSGASATTYSIARQVHDAINWGSGGILVEVYDSYYATGVFNYGMHMARYGYSGNGADVLTKISGGPAPFWTGATFVTGNNYRRDLQITVPPYENVTVRISTAMSVTTDVNNTSQNYVFFF